MNNKMRSNNNYKRNRNRNQSRRNGNGSSNNKSSNFDSSGPEIRVRGSAVQVNEKYMALGNDASMSGDRIKAEAFYQHADHYYRVFMLANGGIDPRKSQNDDSIPNKEREAETLKNSEILNETVETLLTEVTENETKPQENSSDNQNEDETQVVR